MGWNDKYWDIIGNIYWTPRFIGLKSISRDKWKVAGDKVVIPRDLIANSGGPLYSRARKLDDVRNYLNGQEEVLNHFFHLAFSIMGDSVVSRLLCGPLSFDDQGPFDSLGRDLARRYGWGASENVTQPDGFFLTNSSLVAVELKLGSASWAEQVAKYLALMVWEERVSGLRKNLGLLFIVPEQALTSVWQTVGLQNAVIGPEFMSGLDNDKMPDRVRALFASSPDEVRGALERMKLAAVSWSWLVSEIAAVEVSLDPARAGDQTLQRLLTGFRKQIETHDNAGIAHAASSIAELNAASPAEGQAVDVPALRSGYTSREMFTMVDGVMTDAPIHDAILAEGDHETATEVSRQLARECGVSELMIDKLYGNSLTEENVVKHSGGLPKKDK